MGATVTALAATAGTNGNAARTSWAPVPLADVVTGNLSDHPPTLLARNDGPCLLYPSKVHAVFAEPEAGKGWFALHAAAEQIGAARMVVYIDYEDSARTIVGRLRALGVGVEAILNHLVYVRPEEKLTDRGREDLAASFALAPSLVVVDGLTEALSLEGLDMRDNSEVAGWLGVVPRQAANTGAGVLLIDHVAKSIDGRGRYAIGAQHKLAGVDVAYRLEVVQAFGRGREGIVKVLVSKDRHGFIREHAEGDRIAEMHLNSDRLSGAVEVELRPPAASGGDFRPTHLMERVSRAIESQPGLGKREIREAVPGNSKAKDRALELLIAEAFVKPAQDGRAIRHTSVQPYREDSECDHVPDRDPDVTSHGERSDCDHVPPLKGTGHGRAASKDEDATERAHDAGLPLATPEQEEELNRIRREFHDQGVPAE